MSQAVSLSRDFARLSAIEKVNLAALVLGVGAMCVRLWPEWTGNPDLSHGLLMPAVFLVLLFESRSHGTERHLPVGFRMTSSVLGLLAGGLLALLAAGLYAAAVDWSHALVGLSLSVSLVFFLTAALVVYSTEKIGFLNFNWTALVAIGLWLLSTPLPPGTYMRLTLTLQLWVSELVLRSLHTLGIPAIRHGNIIELANAAVGVEEACSGVRSLLSCIFAGFLFSATLVRRPGARALLIILAGPLALVMNFLRSLVLTLLANSGINISGTWHDATGFAVLGLTAAMLGGLALLLERGRKIAPATNEPVAPSKPNSTSSWALSGSLVVAAALVFIFVQNTRSSVRRDTPGPDLLTLLPTSVPGWQVKTTNLYEFRGILQTNYLAQRQYLKGSGSELEEITLYVAYWPAGQVPVSQVASHTPDACLPGSGWTVLPVAQPRQQLLVNNRTLFDAEYRLFKSGNYPQHVWFWHLYDGRPISYRDPYSASELLKIAWRYSFRRAGDQFFVRLSSNRPWSDIQGEQVVADFFAQLRPLGL